MGSQLGVVYVATNGKAYVGKTINGLDDRIRVHKRNAENNIKTHFYNAIRKHGFDAFKWFVLESTDIHSLNECEIYWIKKLNTFKGAGYNMTPGGEGFVVGEDNPAKRPDVRKKNSDSQKIVQNRPGARLRKSIIGKIVQNRPEVRAKRSKALLGKKRKPGFAEKWSVIQKEIQNRVEVKIKKSNSLKKSWKNPVYRSRWMQSRKTNTHSAKLNREKVLEIRYLKATFGYGLPKLAEMFGVSRGTICVIVNNKTWKNIT